MGYNEQRLKNNRNNMKWFMRIHRRLIRPPYPTKIYCPNCGRPFIKVSSDMVEVTNDLGLSFSDLTARDVWAQVKHQSCGAIITLFWKE